MGTSYWIARENVPDGSEILLVGVPCEVFGASPFKAEKG
jgi:hypothetical protein